VAAAASIEVVFGCATTYFTGCQSKMDCDYSHHLRFGFKSALCTKCCSTELVVGTNVHTWQVVIQLVSATRGRISGICIAPEDWPVVLDFDKKICDFFDAEPATDVAPLTSGGFTVKFISGRRGKEVKLSLSAGAVMSIPGSDDYNLMKVYSRESRLNDIKVRQKWCVRFKQCTWKAIVAAAANGTVGQLLSKAATNRRQELLRQCRELFEKRVRPVCDAKTKDEIERCFKDLRKSWYWGFGHDSHDDYAMLSRAMSESVLKELLPEFVEQPRRH